MTQFVQALSQRFVLKDLGPLNYFLGVEVLHVMGGLFLCQHKYFCDVLEQAKMTGAKLVATPFSTSTKLIAHDGSSCPNVTAFRQLVGALQYLSITRPDIAFPVIELSQFMNAPTTNH